MSDPRPSTDPAAGPSSARRTVRTNAFWRAFPAGMRRRWWMFRPFDLIARHWPVFGRRRGLLVVRMDGIGDMVLFRQALDRYAEVFGCAREDVTVLGCKSWAGIAERTFEGYRVIAIDEHAFARRPLYRFRISLMVRRLAPLITVCDSYFRRALMADSLVLVSGAPRTVVSYPYVSEPTRAEFAYYLSQADEVIDTGPYPTHETIRHYAFLSALAGRSIAPEPPRLTWSPAARPTAAAPYVVLNPGSNEPGRRWPAADYAAVARRLLAAGWRVVLVGTGAEGDATGALAALAREPGVDDRVGRTSLPDLVDLMAGAAAVLSNDSGPAHVAIALGVPTVVVVGGGHFGCFFPYPPGVAPANARFVNRDMECYHCFWRCHKRASRYDVFPCVAAVPVDAVWTELAALLGAPAPGRGTAALAAAAPAQ